MLFENIISNISCTYFLGGGVHYWSTGKWLHIIYYQSDSCFHLPGECSFCTLLATVHSVLGAIWGHTTAVTLTSGPERTLGSFSLCPMNNTIGFRKGVKLLCLSLRSQRTQQEVTEKAICVLKGCLSEITTRAAQKQYGESCHALPAE